MLLPLLCKSFCEVYYSYAEPQDLRRFAGDASDSVPVCIGCLLNRDIVRAAAAKCSGSKNQWNILARAFPTAVIMALLVTVAPATAST